MEMRVGAILFKPTSAEKTDRPKDGRRPVETIVQQWISLDFAYNKLSRTRNIQYSYFHGLLLHCKNDGLNEKINKTCTMCNLYWPKSDAIYVRVSTNDDFLLMHNRSMNSGDSIDKKTSCIFRTNNTNLFSLVNIRYNCATE